MILSPWLAYVVYLKDYHSTVMTSSKEIKSRVSSQDPEAVMLAPVGVEADALAHVPDSDGLIFWVGEDQFLPWMEHDTGHIVVVPTAWVNFPGLLKLYDNEIS